MRTCSRIVLAALLTLTLGIAGAVQAQAATSDHRPTYVVAPDGTLHALCRAKSEGGEAALHCEACFAVAAALSVRGGSAAVPLSRPLIGALPVEGTPVHVRPDLMLPQGRGPPVLI
ncbi:hypothetical protein [Pontivivens ytuae]|uniref:DUF2946 domain-containing protein n=1 Tax=Pontivivens ytuae TaxID=2789856 RepID=A0A7S9QE05_9RHOB|nr:hypothetical protein [Pontivivens ytuae]QPH55523.1 hypothetical protein I0K15_07240 [Pontivivens ytuae]